LACVLWIERSSKKKEAAAPLVKHPLLKDHNRDGRRPDYPAANDQIVERTLACSDAVDQVQLQREKSNPSGAKSDTGNDLAPDA
jgi:hypothetical protein